MKIIAIIAALLFAGCAMRRPGESFPWTTHSHTIGDEAGVTTYMGIGRAF
ncbi:MAG: hypothetical protein J5I99_08930 [Verrucomicrobia bacterium]|nr:hypothetical protein [Verrucomicrobiota bacterium]